MDKTEWSAWWNTFLEEKQLIYTVNELNEYDELLGNKFFTEEVCKEIYYSYDEMNKTFLDTKNDLLKSLGELEEVHLHCGRIKKKDSLIEKVITKRYKNIGSQINDYANINAKNYENIITDLVGVKFIVNYRGKWQDIHKKILDDYPMCELAEYNGRDHIEHIDGKKFIAQIPKVYHAPGDDVSQYKEYGLETCVHNKGYRSFHYILSVDKVYVELQVRTIYDEAWSDCDHSYVYKKEANPNSRALQLLSDILCDITNTANDIGENMHDIYYGNALKKSKEDKWYVDKKTADFYNKMLNNLQAAEKKLSRFNECLVEEEVG